MYKNQSTENTEVIVIKILFVCHGNICRSPMAEFIMKKMAEESGRDDLFISSAATSTEEIWNGIGNPIYPPAQEILRRKGIPFDDHRAVQMTRSDYDQYDRIIAMDRYNVRNILRITYGDPDHKICRLLEYCGLDRDVADPWYSGDFETAFRDIYMGCEALIGSC